MCKEETILLLKTIEEFHKTYLELKEKLPYSFNLLDEVRANENAHSKILAKLLAYKEGDNYPFLNSFFQFIGFDDLCKVIDKPEIKAEKERIDISIKDKKYAVIIENKIHNAPEQKKQVDRYVEIVGAKYSQDKIFVLYLTHNGGHPSLYSLSKEIKQELKDNYKAINYKNDILPWLEQNILPNCKFQHSMLISGIQQYIDHLKGMFKTRENMNKMNEQLKNELEEKFDLIKEISLEEKVNEIKKIEDGIKTFGTYLERTKVEYLSEISKIKFNDEYRNKWQKSLNELSLENVISCDTDSRGYWWIGIVFKHNDIKFGCGIGYDNLAKQDKEQLKPFIGLTCRTDKHENKKDQIIELAKNKKLTDFMGSHNTGRWYLHKSFSYEEVLSKFEELVKIIESIDGGDVVK